MGISPSTVINTGLTDQPTSLAVLPGTTQQVSTSSNSDFSTPSINSASSTTSTPNDGEGRTTQSLPTEARIGIAVGIVIAIILVAALIFYAYRQRKLRKHNDSNARAYGSSSGPMSTLQSTLGELPGDSANNALGQISTLSVETRLNKTAFEGHDCIPKVTSSIGTPLPAELAGHYPYTHPAELSSGFDVTLPTNHGAAEGNKQGASSSIACSSLSSDKKCQERTDLGTRYEVVPNVVARHKHAEIDILIQKHAHLEAKKQRMLEIQKVEKEQADIEKRLRALTSDSQ